MVWIKNLTELLLKRNKSIFGEKNQSKVNFLKKMLERSSKNAKRMNNKRKNIRKEKIKKIYKKIKWTNIMNFRIKNKLKNKE